MEENKEKLEIEEEKVTEESKEEKNDDVTSQSEEKKKKHKKDVKFKLEKENEALKAELANLKNEYLKVFAEMENTKKRLKSEAINDRKYASQKLVGELATPVDMLFQIVNMDSANPEVQNYVIGFRMIANQINDILVNAGLVRIDADNKEFNPNIMQAVQTEYDESKPENHVLKVMQHGYMYKDRVLKPAMVVVNKKPEENKKEEKVNEE